MTAVRFARSALLIPAVLVGGVLAGSLALAAPAIAAYPGANGKIVFQTNRDGNFEIYTMNSDGTQVTNVSNSPSTNETRPSWSPDGKRITFSTDRPDAGGLWVMNADGSGKTFLAGNAFGAAWSPDGARIAFVTDDPVNPGSGQWEIYVMNANGTNQTNLTNNPTIDYEPDWSPDGTKIVFISDRDNFTRDVYTMTPSGGSVTRLTTSGGYQEPDWSPDATKIVVRTPGGISMMNADGTGQTQIHSGGVRPVWSPNGAKIAFDSLNAAADIYTINSDGSGEINLTNDPALDLLADWQPLYPIPRSASTIDVGLVPVFKQCGTAGNPANTTHGAPDIPGGTNPDSSCTPPARTSNVSAVGIQAVGSAKITVVPGNPTTVADEADDTIAVNFTDIRSGSATGADYDPSPGADMTLAARLRITDVLNGSSQTSPGTVTELDITVPVDCVATASASVGATCSANTSADAVIPGVVKEGKSAVVQVFRVRLTDSGPNGARGDSDDRLFAMQGVFNP